MIQKIKKEKSEYVERSMRSVMSSLDFKEDLKTEKECYIFRRKENEDEAPIFITNFYKNYRSLKNSDLKKTDPRNEILEMLEFKC